jgi:hypothetical protein
VEVWTNETTSLLTGTPPGFGWAGVGVGVGISVRADSGCDGAWLVVKANMT